uniref:Uncharacterized protein n=1 Tax=Rhinolophus ferrumequinum TaxID=59479 RepID=A0A671DXR6_RHIFE
LSPCQPTMVELGFQPRPDSALHPNETGNQEAPCLPRLHPCWVQSITCTESLWTDNSDEDNGQDEGICRQEVWSKRTWGAKGLTHRGPQTRLKEGSYLLQTRGSTQVGLELHREGELRPALHWTENADAWTVEVTPSGPDRELVPEPEPEARNPVPISCQFLFSPTPKPFSNHTSTFSLCGFA